MLNKIKQWLDKGGGEEWFEPYVTNKDIILITVLTFLFGALIILGFYLTTLQ
jgi:hypothetical protein